MMYLTNAIFIMLVCPVHGVADEASFIRTAGYSSQPGASPASQRRPAA